MGYTLFAMVLLVGITWAAEWSTVLDRGHSEGDLRTHIRHIRLDVFVGSSACPAGAPALSTRYA
jgi:hypothetical protein